jgi:hypothetical protein
MGKADKEGEEQQFEPVPLLAAKLLGLLLVAAWVLLVLGPFFGVLEAAWGLGFYLVLLASPFAFLSALIALFTTSYDDPCGRAICWGVLALAAATLSLLMSGAH